MLTSEMKELRLKYITGSDVGAILGVNKYKSAVDVYLEKIGLKAQKDISDLPRVRFGLMAEPIVTQYFQDATGLGVLSSNNLNGEGWYVSKEHPFMAANVDGMIYTDDWGYVFEAKTAGSYAGWGEQGEFIIPEHYLCQIAHYCAVTNSAGAYLGVLFTHTLEFRWYLYERNLKLEAAIIEKEKNFWHEHVKKEWPPEPVSASDVNALRIKMISGDTLVVGSELECAISTYDSVRVKIKELEKIKEDCKNKIAIGLGDADVAIDGFGKVLATYKYHAGAVRLDGSKVKSDYPEIYKNCLKESAPIRSLRVKTKEN